MLVPNLLPLSEYRRIRPCLLSFSTDVAYYIVPYSLIVMQSTAIDITCFIFTDNGPIVIDMQLVGDTRVY